MDHVHDLRHRYRSEKNLFSVLVLRIAVRWNIIFANSSFRLLRMKIMKHVFEVNSVNHSLSDD